jgi:hypothetical protein
MYVVLREKIELTKDLLKRIRHGAMATVNEDGTPHNTPYFFMVNGDFTKLYWGSHPDSLHSRNVVRTGNLFVVLFDSLTKGKGGLYIAAANGHALEKEELAEGLRVHNATRATFGEEPLPMSYYEEGPQKMWSSDIVKIEVHTTERNEDGHIVQEVRREISAQDLLS